MNCSIEGSSIWSIDDKATVLLDSDSSLPNYDNLYVSGVSTIEVDGEFISRGYNYDLSLGFEVTNTIDKIVSVSGKSVSSKATMNTRTADVRGLAEFKNMNIYPSESVTVGSSSDTYKHSLMTLYNSNLYVYRSDTSTSYRLYLYSDSAIGYPDSAKDRKMSSSYGSNIITQKNTYYGIRYPQRWWKDGDPADLKWTTNEKISSASKYFFVQETGSTGLFGWGRHKSHDKTGSEYSLDGYGNHKQITCKTNADFCDGMIFLLSTTIQSIFNKSKSNL